MKALPSWPFLLTLLHLFQNLRLRFVTTRAHSSVGQPLQSESSPTQQSSAAQPQAASTTSGVPESSNDTEQVVESSPTTPIKENHMSFNFTNLVSDLTNVATKIETAVTDAKLVYQYAAKVMDAAETAYEGHVSAGETKKAAVLAAAKTFANSLGANWSVLESALSAWIDVTIAAWNAAADITGLPTVDASGVSAAVEEAKPLADAAVAAISSVAEATTEEAKTEEAATTEEAKAEEDKTEEAKTEETKTEEATTEEAKTEEVKAAATVSAGL